MLRSASPDNCVKSIFTDGSLDWSNVSSKDLGSPVALDFNLKSLISAQSASRYVKITSKKVQEEEKHFIEIGEYPGEIASQELQGALEEAYNGGKLKDGLTCTGRLFTTNGQREYCKDFLSKQNPEFEFNGEKYVRVVVWTLNAHRHYADGTNMPCNKHTAVWHKVEPVKLEIKNWDELPQNINPRGKRIGGANIIKTETEECILSGLPFYPDWHDENCPMWQNSLVRAFLNSAKSSELDGNPEFKAPLQWDFTKSGFLYQAFDMTREPTKEYTIPETEKEVADYAFTGCVGIEKIIIPSHVTTVDYYAFSDCPNAQVVFEKPNKNLYIAPLVYGDNNFNFVYLSKDGNQVIYSPYEDSALEKSCFKVDYNEVTFKLLIDYNYRANFVKTKLWKESGKIKFIPPEYTLKIFPTGELEKYFVNNNNQRWAKLVKTLEFDTLSNDEKTNSLTDLMKIYYAIGGFSENQGESERAFDYILKYVSKVYRVLFDYNGELVTMPNGAPYYIKNPTPSQIGEEIHSRFSKLQLNGPYNPEFAKFFMKYYKDDPDFMVFELNDDYKPMDYLCAAHNSFAEIQKAFPNRVVNGNEERSLLTPKFVAEHCSFVEYEDVDEGNEALANLVGRYCYSQNQFEHIQDVYNKAKELKNKYVISADKADEEHGISFRVLEKDDPLGFVLGDITNCCQHVGGVGGSCVDDGYLNPEAGFLVFEESILDENGNPTDEKRILGQAYIWYDPETKTVCYDNIEIPTKILDELHKGDKHNSRLSSSHLLDAVVKSAEKIMLAMNKKGIKVERVTTGQGYNDLARQLEECFGAPERNPKARHRNYTGYSDARSAQYVIKDIRAYKPGFTDKKISSARLEEGYEIG